jgi:hypothetical protein
MAERLLAETLQSLAVRGDHPRSSVAQLIAHLGSATLFVSLVGVAHRRLFLGAAVVVVDAHIHGSARPQVFAEGFPHHR